MEDITKKPAEYQDCIVTRKDKIGIISINRTKQLNALTLSAMDEIIRALKEFDADPEVRVIILKGEGRAFCTGHMLEDLRHEDRTEQAKVFAKPAEIIQTMQSIKKPVIGSVQGYAIAVGMALVGACDVVIAAEKTKFQCPGAGFGIVCGTPTLGIFRSLPRKKVLELNFTAERMDVVDAERFGLINKIVPAEQLEAATMEFAEKVASNAPIAVQTAKLLYYELSGMATNQTANLCAELMAANADTDDARESLAALIEKRPHAPFKGK